MDSVPCKAFLLVQLLLLFSCFQDASCDFPYPPVHAPTQHHHHHHPAYPPVKPPAKPPVKPPVKPPAYPPIKPPAYPPVKPPAKPPVTPPVKPPAYPPIKPPVHPPVSPPVHSPPSRKFIAVQGVVYCKSCKNTPHGSNKPIFGAKVKLLCKNTRFSAAVATATTDKNGYFFLQAPKTVSSFASHKCKAYLVSSPISSCSQPTNLHGGVTGAKLRWEMWPSIKYPFILYSVGPFAFEPKCKAPGPK